MVANATSATTVTTSDAPELGSDLAQAGSFSARLMGFWAELVLQIIWQNELFVLFVDIKICTNGKILFNWQNHVKSM